MFSPLVAAQLTLNNGSISNRLWKWWCVNLRRLFFARWIVLFSLVGFHTSVIVSNASEGGQKAAAFVNLWKEEEIFRDLFIRKWCLDIKKGSFPTFRIQKREFQLFQSIIPLLKETFPVELHVSLQLGVVLTLLVIHFLTGSLRSFVSLLSLMARKCFRYKLSKSHSVQVLNDIFSVLCIKRLQNTSSWWSTPSPTLGACIPLGLNDEWNKVSNISTMFTAELFKDYWKLHIASHSSEALFLLLLFSNVWSVIIPSLGQCLIQLRDGFVDRTVTLWITR